MHDTNKPTKNQLLNKPSDYRAKVYQGAYLVVDFGNYVCVSIKSEKVLIDKTFLPEFLKYKWYVRSGKKIYVKKRVYRNIFNGGKCNIKYLSRIVINAKKWEIVDHINGNTLDNRKINLRICEHCQNLMNRCASRRNKTGYKGVVFDKKSHKYIARIGYRGKSYYLGVFYSAEDAAISYNRMVKKYHKKFGVLNKIKKGTEWKP